MTNSMRYLSVVALAISNTTQAQTNPPAMLEEVIVTAEKRSANLQDVPSSINAFSGEAIANEGWKDIHRLQEAVPSLVIGGESRARPYISIRGVGTRKFDIGTDSSVAIFIDEIYVARFSASLNGIMDLEQIEVLKGPQGTLWGRNTIGGAISMTTRKPTNELEAHFKAGIGNEGYYQLGGSISGPIVEDKLLARLSVSTSDIDGVYEDTVSGNTNNNEINAARLNVLGFATERWEIGVSADYNKVKADAVLTEIVPGDAFPVVLVSPQDPRVPGVVAEGAEARYQNAYSTPGYVDRENSQVALKAVYEGETVEFLSLTSYSDEDYTELRDFDGTSINVWNQYIDQSSDQVSQEFRLSSVDGGFATFGDRLKWVAGLYYYEDHAKRLDRFDVSQDAILNPPSLGLFNAQTWFDMKIDVTSYAVFGQATYALTDKMNLTLGLRYTKDEKSFANDTRTNNTAPPVAESFLVSDKANFSSTDPKITLDYHFTDEVMAYATYAKGYKSGGIQFAVGTPEDALKPIDEERLDSFEVGVKSRFWDQRVQLNASAYFYDFQDQQLQQIIQIEGAPVAITENAAESDMTGIELELLALLTDSVTLDIKYAWQDAKFGDFESEEGDFSGNHMPASPENAVAINLTKIVELPDMGSLTFRAGYSWKDQQYFNFRNDELALQDDYGIVNLAAWWDFADDRTRVRVFCDNCNDEEYLANFTSFPALFGGGRRSWEYGRLYGLEVAYAF